MGLILTSRFTSRTHIEARDPDDIHKSRTSLRLIPRKIKEGHLGTLAPQA